MSERWLPIPLVAGAYEASDRGRIRRVGNAPLKLIKANNGRFIINACWDGQRRSFSADRLIANAFMGERPKGTEISHLDGNVTNNAPANLVYESHSENCRRRAAHGTQYIQVSQSLTEEQAILAFDLRAKGALQREIAHDLGVAQCTISRLLSGKTWARQHDRIKSVALNLS